MNHRIYQAILSIFLSVFARYAGAEEVVQPYAFTENLRWNFGLHIYRDVYRVDGGSKTTAVQYGFAFANIRFHWS